MRDYGRVYSAFWQSPEVRAMSEDGRVLALYLLTCPHANLIGCFRLPNAYAADDLQWSSVRVSQGFDELIAKGFMSVDQGTRWLLIHKYLKWNTFESPNVAIAAHKAFDQVPNLPLKSLLANTLLEFGAHIKEPFAKALEALAKPFANPEPEPEPILNQNLSLIPATTGISCAPPSEGTPPPKTAKRSEPSTTASTWAAYSGAYRSRYGVDPIRNAKVNGQLAQFVARVGLDEAPAIAAHYVGHQKAWYVQNMHPIDSLLKDAETLRTSWATGKNVTSSQAAMADRTDTNRNAFQALIDKENAKEIPHGQH